MSAFELLEQFGNVRRSLGRAITPSLQEFGIGPKQLIVLRVVGQQRRCSMSDIAEATASDMASVTRMVASLVATGWVEKQKDDGDRRQWIVKLAPKGVEQWENIYAVVRALAATFASELNQAEQTELLRLLNKVQKGLESSIASHSGDHLGTFQER